MLVFAFCLATTALLLQGVVLPGFSFFAFAPWIALAALRCSLLRATWYAALAGLLVDLLSDHPFGIHAASYAAAAALLFRLRKHFLADRPLHLALYSALISWTITVLLLFFLFLFDRRVPFAGIWMFGDLFVMPAIDGLYACIWFSGPLALFAKIRRWWVLFWLKRKHLSPISR